MIWCGGHRLKQTPGSFFSIPEPVFFNKFLNPAPFFCAVSIICVKNSAIRIGEAEHHKRILPGGLPRELRIICWVFGRPLPVIPSR